MTDDELLFAAIEDKVSSCRGNYMITNTNFLDAYQQSTALRYLSKNKNIRFEFYGGFEDCERKIIIFIPDYIDNIIDYFKENPNDNPIVPLNVQKDGFSTLSHRDYLGSIMALGIRREMMGDIIIEKKGCSISVMRSISKYLVENLTSAGRGTLKAEIAASFESPDKEEAFEEKKCFVSTMRADSVVASAFGISRSMACEKIRRADVFVNGVVTEKTDAHIQPSSKIVLRGKGKVIISDDVVETKKGRLMFTAKKFV